MVFCSDIMCHAVGFVPRVHSKGILVVVDGEDLFGMEVKEDLFKVLGRSVNIFPVRVILSIFKESEFNRAETFVYVLEAFVVTAVASNIDFATAGFNHEGSPKRLVSFAQKTIGEMS